MRIRICHEEPYNQINNEIKETKVKLLIIRTTEMRVLNEEREKKLYIVLNKKQTDRERVYYQTTQRVNNRSLLMFS